MIAAPVLVSFITGLLCLAARKRGTWVRWISFGGSCLTLVVSLVVLIQVWEMGPQTLQFGSWPRPFAISFSIQTLGALLVAVSAALAFVGNMAMQILSYRQGYHSFFHFMTMGVLGAFSTGDIFNLYVWFEVFLVASFFLVGMCGQRGSLTGAFKYAVLSILSSIVFLLGVSFIYGSLGTLDLQDIVTQIHARGSNVSAQMGLTLLALAFAVKAALFPFFFWLPASYPATLTPVTAVMSGFLTKVGVYAMLRTLVPIFNLNGSDNLLPVLYVLSLTSMLFGVLGALSRDNMKAILAFHSISQIGYICLGLSIGSAAGLTACVFYIFHHMLVKTNLFFSVAYMESVTGNCMVSESGGLWAARPFLGVVFAFSALSLIGFPPLSGFWAKVITIQALLPLEHWVGVALCLVVSFFTMMSMLKIWLGVFWKRPVATLNHNTSKRLRWLLVPLTILNIGILSLGLAAQPVMQVIERSMNELLVLGEKP